MARILLIEGDPGERLVMRSRLADLGHEVLVAEGGARGLVEARASGADLILLSMDLGSGISAADVCKRLKATPGLNRVPILVYASKQATLEQAQRMYDMGCEAYIDRTHLPHLDRILDVHLRIKSQGDELAEQCRLLERENHRLCEADSRLAEATASASDPVARANRKLAAGHPDGVLLVDSEGIVRDCDRGAFELLGPRIQGTSLGKIAPGCGLEAFVRDARTAPRQGFRFETSERRDRSPRSLIASVLPTTAGESSPLRVVLFCDLGRCHFSGGYSSADGMVPRQEVGALVEAARMTYVPGAIIGSSAATLALRSDIARLADLNGPVLLHGERGSGEELLARILHYSGRRTGSFLELNCSALSEEALEQELFGKAGDSEGESHPGLLALCQDGTLYLAQVSALPTRLQARLEEVLERGTLLPPGARRKERLECRIIASTSEGLEALVAKGAFHGALAQRLGARVLRVPPLRERREDIVRLARAMLLRFGCAHGVESLSPQVEAVLAEYPWPGNLAELEACMEHACGMARNGVIEISHLTQPVRELATEISPVAIIPSQGPPSPAERPTPVPGTHLASHEGQKAWSITEDDPIDFDVYEKKVLLRALDCTGGDKLAAARLLHVGKSTLYRKLKKFGIT